MKKKLVEIDFWSRWRFWRIKEMRLNGVRLMCFGLIGDTPVDINIFLLGVELLQILVYCDKKIISRNSYRKRTYIRLALFNFSLSINIIGKKLFRVT